MNTQSRLATQWALIVVVVVGLAIDAYVHFDLASAFDVHKTSTMSVGDLFRVEASVAVLAAVLLIARPRRYTAAFAFIVLAAGFIAVLVTRYVDVGSIGPVPNTYDPYWEPTGKWVSAVAEGVGALAGLALLMLMQSVTRRSATGSTAVTA